MKFAMKWLAMAALLCVASAPALAEIVVVVNPGNAAGAVGAEQVAQIFLGTSTAMKPVDQAEGSGIRQEFYKKVADKEPGQVKAIWSKLVFTGKGKQPKECASSDEVKKMVAADPAAIGYIEKSAVDASVKVVLTVQ